MIAPAWRPGAGELGMDQLIEAIHAARWACSASFGLRISEAVWKDVIEREQEALPFLKRGAAGVECDRFLGHPFIVDHKMPAGFEIVTSPLRWDEIRRSAKPSMNGAAGSPVSGFD